MALDYKIRIGDEMTISWIAMDDEYVRVETIISKDNTLHYDVGEGISKEEYFKRKLADKL